MTYDDRLGVLTVRSTNCLEASMILEIRHNIEVAHRLYRMDGNKCQNIHGHSMWVTLGICDLGLSKDNNLATSRSTGKQFEFGAVKKTFRDFLDAMFDHHVLLNEEDPWAQTLHVARINDEGYPEPYGNSLPGLVKFPGDPTTENIAYQIALWAEREFGKQEVYNVKVQETHVNAAELSILDGEVMG